MGDRFYVHVMQGVKIVIFYIWKVRDSSRISQVVTPSLSLSHSLPLHACIGSACATVYPLTVELFVVSSFSQFSSNNVVHKLCADQDQSSHHQTISLFCITSEDTQ